MVVPFNRQRKNLPVEDDIQRVLVRMFQELIVFFNDVEQADFRILLPHSVQVQDQHAGVEIVEGIVQAQRLKFPELAPRIPRYQAAQHRRIPYGAHGRPAEVRIVKLRYVRIQDRIRIQIDNPGMPGEQAGCQQARVGQGGKAFHVPPAQHLFQLAGNGHELKGCVRITGNGLVQFLHVFFFQPVMDHPQPVVPFRVGMACQGMQGDGQAHGPGGGDGKHDVYGRRRSGSMEGCGRCGGKGGGHDVKGWDGIRAMSRQTRPVGVEGF